MKIESPSPATTLVVILGAKEWPDSPDFHGSEAFANAASDFRKYILGPNHFGLPQKNFLDLFDTEEGPDKIDRMIRQFLTGRISEMKKSENAARDLLVYFVGHGGFIGRNSEYYLAVRCTSSDNPDVSGIRIESFVNTITEKARSLRRVFILDCCYAGAAYRAFQAEGPAQVATRQMISVLKEKAKTIGEGASLLCSSGRDAPSRLSPDGSYTMFSRALSQALTIGNPHRLDRLYLSLREVADLTEERLQSLGGEAPRPEVHSPDQADGDVANIPFFPNLAVKTVLRMSTPPSKKHQSVVQEQGLEEDVFITPEQMLAFHAKRWQREEEEVIPLKSSAGTVCCSLGHENPAGSGYCDECGEALTATAPAGTTAASYVVCPSCGTSNPVGKGYWPYCSNCACGLTRL